MKLSRVMIQVKFMEVLEFYILLNLIEFFLCQITNWCECET